MTDDCERAAREVVDRVDQRFPIKTLLAPHVIERLWWEIAQELRQRAKPAEGGQP